MGWSPRVTRLLRSGLARRHTTGAGAGTRWNAAGVWGHQEGEKEGRGAQVPSSAAPSLHSSLETGAGGPKNSPQEQLPAGRPGDLLGSAG